MASSAFKKGIPDEHDLYLVLAITPNQTLAEEDQLTKQASYRHNRFSSRNKDKCKSSPRGDAIAEENYTKFSTSIHQILAQVKDKPWVKRPPPLTGDSDKRDTRKYCAFYGMHGYNMNNCFAWRTHLEERLSRPPSITMPYVDSFIYSPAFGSSSPTASPPLL
ncbi:PREDICTED: LOC110773696 partial [Prunus dulcis]|uniref:PREDICTED: LOC110773696 partial n=1 Tax=Prunus dulcis TaxID=3755 RepID=A0A5E4GE29_PRUDU|nr:PREDICTED: LOC110773696 partial [Prunus dulcis]